MTGNYYYLVAGLPDLLLDQGKQPLMCRDFIDEAMSLLSDADQTLFNRLRFPFDNSNLLAALEKKSRPFDMRGSIEEAELLNGLKYSDELPEYMQHFLEAHRDNKLPLPGAPLADQLALYFYGEMETERNDFIREYYTFDRDLRNLVTAINCRKGLEHIDSLSTERERSISTLIIGNSDMAELLRKSTAPDFGVATLFPLVETVLALAKNSPVDFEKGLDTLRWDTVNELTSALYFKAEAVFAFFIKLTIVERWQALDPKTGQAQLDRLIKELTASYTIPAVF